VTTPPLNSLPLSRGGNKGGVISVALGRRSYDIEYLATIADIRRRLSPVQGREFALIDAHVDTLHGKAFRKALPRVEFLRIAAGESSKSFLALEKIANSLVKAGATRASRLIAIGGGVVGDLTGFLAGVFMRGIPFVQVPTTLLAMVDSSVGGKTAVNLASGKNLVGVFHQPQAVFVIPSLLKTLPLREIKCGLSEAIKTALIADKNLVLAMENHSYSARRFDLDFLSHLSAAAIRIKADIVAKDEKEENIRAYLNFGHTLAHAIEAATHYRGVLHGEAVAVGQRFAALLSRRLGLLGAQDESRIHALLKKYQLPTRLGDVLRTQTGSRAVNPPKLLELMRSDKKNQSSAIRFVLLAAIGEAQLPRPVADKELLASLKEFLLLA